MIPVRPFGETVRLRHSLHLHVSANKQQHAFCTPCTRNKKQLFGPRGERRVNNAVKKCAFSFITYLRKKVRNECAKWRTETISFPKHKTNRNCYIKCVNIYVVILNRQYPCYNSKMERMGRFKTPEKTRRDKKSSRVVRNEWDKRRQLRKRLSRGTERERMKY